ncbi:hypothetical protein LAC81_07725 [Ensifer adhaerens]|uniref:hypothetical protein n=1 Tax=Ensifer adhaerens TaxID=106592 RepID=UPI001CBB6017|nr:hypothetical protein [Ensifer adhaerens]MBZ7921669.1 hypothetical protein [Ensifer adhaerens]UAX94084.1 hypothetical protein LAC78_07720 [Ensifer adhaerens]UAY01718.1 hypothetical protein LAC80_07725 [Ensifer adhaerens]UAY09102.1 hypothetical protein LAC81_07725 [Ensifer adhaerens]
MTLTYRTSGAWGSGKGSNLTAAEIDGNTHELAERVAELEGSAPEPNQISNITQAGNTITIHLEDGSTFGPFILPRPVQRPTQAVDVTDDTLTPAVAQAMYYFRCAHGFGCEITIPANSTHAFLVDAELHFRQSDAGPLTFVAADGVTLNLIDGYSAATDRLGAVVTVKKVDTDTWDVFGLLAPETP